MVVKTHFVKLDYSLQKGGKRNCFKAALKRQGRNIHKQIEKRELMGNCGKMVRKMFEKTKQGKQWVIKEHGIVRSSGIVIELLKGQSRESIKDALSDKQPSTEFLDLMYEKYGPATSTEPSSETGNSLLMAEHYLKEALEEHDKKVVQDMVAKVLQEDGVREENGSGDGDENGENGNENGENGDVKENGEHGDGKSTETKQDTTTEHTSTGDVSRSRKIENEHEEQNVAKKPKNNVPKVGAELKEICFIRNGKPVRFCTSDRCKVGFHFDCYNKIYNHGQDLKKRDEEYAKNFYGRMHPFKRDDCVKLKEFDAEDNRAYFKVGMEDKLKRRNCPRSCTFCGRDFVVCCVGFPLG